MAAGSTCIAQSTADGIPADFRLSPKPDIAAVNAFYAKLLARGAHLGFPLLSLLVCITHIARG